MLPDITPMQAGKGYKNWLFMQAYLHTYNILKKTSTLSAAWSKLKAPFLEL